MFTIQSVFGENFQRRVIGIGISLGMLGGLFNARRN